MLDLKSYLLLSPDESPEKTKKKKHSVLFFPEENTAGHAPTSNIVDGVIEEENQVRIKWDNEEVPAKVLRLTGTFLKS